MTIPSSDKKKILWLKAILNGILAWVVGLLLYTIPAFIMALQMGFELGPKLQNSGAVGAKISQSISVMYRESRYLPFLYMVIMALIIFWRSQRLSTIPESHSKANGAIVGAIPALMGVVLIVVGKFDVITAVEIFVFVGAGILGGRKKS